MRLNKLLKYNGHFWHVGSIGMCLFLILAAVVLALELLKGIPFLTSGIEGISACKLRTTYVAKTNKIGGDIFLA